MAVLFLIVMLCVFYPAKSENREETSEKAREIGKMEQVKQRIDKAYELKERLEKIDNMIIDMELIKANAGRWDYSVQLQYITTNGKDEKVEIWCNGGKETEKILELLMTEREKICCSLYSEIENIPKRYGQNDDKTTETPMKNLSFHDVVKTWTNQERG